MTGRRTNTSRHRARRDPRSARWTATVLALLASSACFSDRPDPTEPPVEGEVVIDMTPSLTFSPASVTIQSGQTVVWRNVSTFPHTTTGDASKAGDPSNVNLPEGAAPWDSGTLTGGQEFRRTFAVPGAYRYFCIPHEISNMVGTITVE